VNCSDISAVLVTKGDVDLSPILESLPFDDIVVWDNSKRKLDVKVYGRYLGIAEAKHEWIYVQDDDCVVPVREFIERAEKGAGPLSPICDNRMTQEEIACNIPSPGHRRAYAPLGISLVGWGALFHRNLRFCFDRYFGVLPFDDLFYRECDRVFTALNPFFELDLPIRRLEYESNSDRMWKQPGHGDDLRKILHRIAAVKASTSASFAEATR